MMERREFLRTMIAGAAVGLLHSRVALAQETKPAKNRPNFLIILTDDQRWDSLGVVQKEQGERARFPWLQTPNLDKFADAGVRFRNAFVVFSLCSPSRASFLTGQYGHVNGVEDNRTEFPSQNLTFSTLLRDAGYATAHIGKWHMHKQAERPGFSYSATYIEQGDYFNCPFLINGQSVTTEGWVDDVATEYAIKYLQEDKDKPFLLLLGYKATHDDYQPPPRHAVTYQGESARPVPNLGKHAVYAASESSAASKPKKERNRADEILNYMRCVTAMDENVGKIMNELERLNLSEDTIVVFAGDNGFHLGEHGMYNKRDAYEESMRIPLLWRYPRAGNGGTQIDKMALNIDLAPTLLDYAGIAVPPTMQGRSWRPILENEATEWRQSFLYAYKQESAKSQLSDINAVRTETAKLITYKGHDDWAELYDLVADPYETTNLINEPAKQPLKAELEQEMQKLQQAVAKR